jgi:hypothetical protein
MFPQVSFGEIPVKLERRDVTALDIPDIFLFKLRSTKLYCYHGGLIQRDENS